MLTKIPTNLIAALSHSKSWDDERRLNMMIKLLEAFPERFDELTENVYWEVFLPLLARDKQERSTKYKDHAIFQFFSKEWNENYREYVFDINRVRMIHFMTRRREVRIAQVMEGNKFGYGVLTQKKLNRRIDHLLSTEMLMVVRVNNPLGVFVNVSDRQVQNDRKFVNEVEADGSMNIKFAEIRSLRGLEISQMDLYKQMFVAKVEQVYYVFDQRMTNGSQVMCILEPIKIPFIGADSYKIPEDPINIIPTDFIGDESDAPDGFSMFVIGSEMRFGVVLSKIYKVETATRIVYCIFGYFGEHKRTVIVPQRLTDFYFGPTS